MTDDVTLTIGGRAWGGWKAARVTRGVERCPSDFSLVLSERWPGKDSEVFAMPGDACTVAAGGDVLVTGYIDRVSPSVSPLGHEIHVSGRGRCADLVDCSAIADNSQFVNRSVLDIARAVAAPFGIGVRQTDTGGHPLQGAPRAADGGIVPQLNVTLVDTPWNIIEQAARFAALLCYEDVSGDVVLSSVGTRQHASGFAEGVNVQGMAATFGMDMRYSEYIAVMLAVDATLQLSPGAAAGGTTPANVIARVRDEYVTRRRPLIIVSEQGYASLDIAKRRAEWERSRRYGRSNCVNLTCDTWRDAAGRLWTPNTLAEFDLPSLHLKGRTWLIAEVTFLVDQQRGRVADITLMPKEAFAPAPPPVLYDWQAIQAIRGAQ